MSCDNTVSILLFLGTMLVCTRAAAFPAAAAMIMRHHLPSKSMTTAGTRTAAVSRVVMMGISSTSSSGGIKMPELPLAVEKYAQVPSGNKNKRFTATTIPKGLLKQHSTKSGTWGVIRVFQGRLEYQINRSSANMPDGADVILHTFELDQNVTGIIEPTVLHQVKPLTEDVEFVVEFYRLPGTGPVDEKRE